MAKRGPKPKAEKKTPAARGSVPGDNNGTNGDALSEAERSALFINELNKLEALKAKVASATADMRNQRKRMKSDGFMPYEIDFGLKLRKADENEMLEQRAREARVARWLAHPVGTQSYMFSEDRPEGNGGGAVPYSGRVDPRELGRLAGSEGAVCKPPANLNQDDAQRWITGWQVGQAAMAGAGIKAPGATPDF